MFVQHEQHSLITLKRLFPGVRLCDFVCVCLLVGIHAVLKCDVKGRMQFEWK